MLDEVATVSLLPRVAAAPLPTPARWALTCGPGSSRRALRCRCWCARRVLPRLQSDEDDELLSQWSPVLDESSDRATLRTIQRSMPAAATALTWDAEAQRGSAREALADYLAATIDCVVASRAAAARRPVSAARRR